MEEDRKVMDNERKKIDEKLSHSVIEEEYQQKKRRTFEPCKLIAVKRTFSYNIAKRTIHDQNV